MIERDVAEMDNTWNDLRWFAQDNSEKWKLALPMLYVELGARKYAHHVWALLS